MYGMKAMMSMVWTSAVLISAYHILFMSEYYFGGSGTQDIGEYYKSAFVKSKMMPVLMKEEKKILVMIKLVASDSVCNPIKLTNAMFIVRIIMFITEISTVTVLLRTIPMFLSDMKISQMVF